MAAAAQLLSALLLLMEEILDHDLGLLVDMET
jgi:hypothetical protein